MVVRLDEINIYDVAEKAGVSKSTVSRVLNRSKSVSEVARMRVEEAVRELGYSPNAAARRLAGSVDKRIGLILPFFSEMFSSFYVHEILRGVGEIISERDAELLLHIDNSAHGEDRIQRRLRQNGARGGWLLADEAIPVEVLEHLLSHGIPFVLLNRAVNLPRANYVTVDNRSGARRATEYLIGLGHRRIATITGSLELQPGRERLNGFEDAIRAVGLDMPESYVAQCNFTQNMAALAASQMLALPNPPTAVFAASDLMAAGIYDAASAAGVRIPEDLSVVGFDDDSLAIRLSPKLTTVHQPLNEMARLAAKWLLDCLEDNAADYLRQALSAELVVRESCRATDEFHITA